MYVVRQPSSSGGSADEDSTQGNDTEPTGAAQEVGEVGVGNVEQPVEEVQALVQDA